MWPSTCSERAASPSASVAPQSSEKVSSWLWVLLLHRERRFLTEASCSMGRGSRGCTDEDVGGAGTKQGDTDEHARQGRIIKLFKNHSAQIIWCFTK